MSSSDRRPYLSATVLNQAFLDACHDNLECGLEMVVEVETTDDPILISDRNKYIVTSGVGKFYEARTNIPVISRTVGDWLVPEIQFSTLTLDAISNVDGRYNKYLPGGENYSSWINKLVTVKLGLREVGSTYFKIFEGRITDVGGMSRTVKSISVTARDKFDSLTKEFPREVFTIAAFPELEESYEGRYSPVIYGDWTVNLDPDKAVIPAFAVNGANPYVNGSAADIETVGYTDLDVIVTTQPLTYFDTANVYLESGGTYWPVPSSEIYNLSANNNRFKVRQNTAVLWKDGEAYKYNAGDTFYVRVKGKALTPIGAVAMHDNIVWQARDILITYGGVTSADFDANWETFALKNDTVNYPQSAISTFKSRIYENEPKTAIQYALSLLEQVRLEAFISKDQLIKINSLHFEDWAPQNYTIKNWDLEANTFKPSLSERDIFNRARGTFDFHPNRNEQAQQTKILKNPASITQLSGKEISKQITFPNLYQPEVVKHQVKEILKIASSSHELADFTATWRSVLKDVGDIIKLDISIGSVVMSGVPAMIREVGYDPRGFKIPMRVWILQLLPFSSSSLIAPGTVGGYNANIIEE